MNASSRRSFLQSSAATAAGAALVAAQSARGAGDVNSRIRVAMIGLGGRSQSHLASLSELTSENVELAVICDADETVLALASRFEQVQPWFQSFPGLAGTERAV